MKFSVYILNFTENLLLHLSSFSVSSTHDFEWIHVYLETLEYQKSLLYAPYLYNSWIGLEMILHEILHVLKLVLPSLEIVYQKIVTMLFKEFWI